MDRYHCIEESLYWRFSDLEADMFSLKMRWDTCGPLQILDSVHNEHGHSEIGELNIQIILTSSSNDLVSSVLKADKAETLSELLDIRFMISSPSLGRRWVVII